MKPYFPFSSTRRILTLSLLAAGLLAQDRLAAQSAAIAKVGDEEIAPEKIRAYFENLSAEDRGALEKNPAMLNQAVRALIMQQLLFKEAQTAGWDKQADVIERIERTRQGVIVESYLETVTKVPDAYPSESEIKAAFEAKKEALVLPKQVQVAQIFVAQDGADKAAADKAKQQIDEIAKKLKQPNADFAAVARAESDEPTSAAKGGEVGWLAEASLQPGIRTKVSGLGKGAVSEPINLQDGWYLVKVLDIKEARPATLEEVKPRLSQFLRTERARANRDAYLAKLQQQYPVALNELALAKLLQPAKQ